MRVETLRAGDNFIYVLVAGQRAAVVDPGVAGPVQAFLDAEGLTLELILLTHYHGDHTGGVSALRRSGCVVAGPAGGPVALDRVVVDGEALDFGHSAIEVLDVPGHTAHDTAYCLPDEPALFTGDVLFAGGCGRLFGGDAAPMWRSLCRLRALPAETRLYGGHDYTLDNLEFAVHLEPDHPGVRERLARFRADPHAAHPSTLAEEKRTNPFLRCDDPALAATIGMPGRDVVAVFAAVRGMKDRW
ncbi:MAG: hydroxyacylglutathione hydrolase [Verrucomicrobia bacterium]|jgi:hydroxyacylglutathione hydrolase|nr:hydroxyacylglutathione hydrolase [Verrucomicrobiota bacterium]MBT7065058.1 hydroxyacylglutathione hydrolase [Verrucomicrobiota bacterium]MBT7699585.1 hydroxyacylglutathione hydrolase [Verrucomicrobiota bacterium]